jgi:hypothetical protein
VERPIISAHRPRAPGHSLTKASFLFIFSPEFRLRPCILGRPGVFTSPAGIRALYSEASLIGLAKILSRWQSQPVSGHITVATYRQTEPLHGLGKSDTVAHEDKLRVLLQSPHFRQSLFIHHLDIDKYEVEIVFRIEAFWKVLLKTVR